MNPALIDLPAPPGAVSTPRAAAPGPVEHARQARHFWWQWPHLLSLDAPLVALVWQRWWARSTGTSLPSSREWMLGLGVWLIYLADRLADTAGQSPDGARAARHRFARRRRSLLLPLALAVATTLTALTLYGLPVREFRPGLGLLALAIGYFGLIHYWPGQKWAAYLPKEAAVGAMFAAGTVFFVVCRTPRLPASFWLASSLFAAVCFLNCALITKWERQIQDVRERSSLLNSFAGFSAHLGAACLMLATASLAVALATSAWCAIPVAASGLLLAGLDRFEADIPVEVLRVTADLALLTPLLGGLVSLTFG